MNDMSPYTETLVDIAPPVHPDERPIFEVDIVDFEKIMHLLCEDCGAHMSTPNVQPDGALICDSCENFDPFDDERYYYSRLAVI